MSRARLAFLGGLILLVANLSLTGAAHADATPVRIGYQKYGSLVLLKATGAVDRRLAALGYRVQWSEFAAGPQLLEALNVGSLDFGTAGEAPPVFAQAAGADLVYLANQPPAPTAEAIVVPKDSPIRSVADLKGKRIALNKGSNVHYLLIKALQSAGLQYSDIQPVFLPPADARAAFTRGAVDAWAIWDPFLASAEKTLSARVIVNGSGIVSNHQFFLATRTFAQQHADVVKVIIEELHAVDKWGEKNPAEVAKVLGPAVGIDAVTAQHAAERFSFGVVLTTPKVAAEQQKVADAFAELKLIPRSIRISDALLAP